MKTKEELNALKSEVEALNKKLAELTEEELAEVAGGFIPAVPPTFIGSVTVEVGKWYKLKESAIYEFHVPGDPSSVRWYCAEDLGGNLFRFEGYGWTQSVTGNTVTYLTDSISNGSIYEPSSAPFPLPEKFRS